MEVIILKKDFNIIKDEIDNSTNPTCILCESDIWVDYGDDKSGYVYCKECFDIYSCFCCKKMNISIYGKKIIIRELYGLNFKLFCGYCWSNKDIYHDSELDIIEEVDSTSYELNDDDLAEDNNSGSDEEMNNHDLYHSTKGKYDLY